MGFIGHFDSDVLKSLLRVSNYWAKINRNNYPINMANTLLLLYEYVPCPCNSDCQCKQLGCTHHYVRKTNITLEDAKLHFLSNFVDVKMRDAISSGNKNGRGKKAIDATKDIQAKWTKLPVPLTKHLLCTDWCDKDWKKLALSFKANSDTIYSAKWLAILALDTFMAYDTRSVLLFNRDYRGDTYFDFLSNIRADLLNHLKVNNASVQSFRLYDNPNEYFPSLPPNHPGAIGNILDKLFLIL